MGWGYGMGMGPWGWVMMGGFWLLLLAAAIVTVAWIFPRDRRGTSAPGSLADQTGSGGPAVGQYSHPLTVLDDRLARGEIDIETYRALRAELTASAARSAGAGVEQVR